MTVQTSAVLSECGQYRYSLLRVWDSEKPRCLFVMLNPSTADAQQDDPTIRRCVGFAKGWGYGSLEVVNLFALRATDPEDMLTSARPVGEDNDRYIQEAQARSCLVVVAWGSRGSHLNRDREVLSLLLKPHCLSVTKQGQPGHPLYLPSSSVPFIYEVKL